MKNRTLRSGFTLLEIMLATSILAVGTVSVLSVFATAVGFANRRQTQAELQQVLDEARSEARSLVDGFKAGKPAATKSGKRAGPVSNLPGGPEGKVEEKTSSVYLGYRYALRFEHVVRDVPDAGFKATISVKWGDDLSHEETLTVLPGNIPAEEFTFSATHAEEQAGRVTPVRENR
jgi:prepilin-type N-terminal cleavage/methylation domain-containing protein